MRKKTLIALGVFVLLIGGAFAAITNGLAEGQSVVLSGIDMSNVSDGDYAGTYENGRWTNTVTVHVKAGEITGIDIVKDVAAAEVTDCSGEVFCRVLENQDTQVDAVSGATVTSKAYLKAIEDALK